MRKRESKLPTRIKLSPIGRHPKHRKRDPYDARTLRYVARALLRERDALLRLEVTTRWTQGRIALASRARQCEIHGLGFAKEARAIERKAKTNE